MPLAFADVAVPNKAFKRVVRDLEFDVAELALMTFLMARSRGVPLDCCRSSSSAGILFRIWSAIASDAVVPAGSARLPHRRPRVYDDDGRVDSSAARRSVRRRARSARDGSRSRKGTLPACRTRRRPSRRCRRRPDDDAARPRRRRRHRRSRPGGSAIRFRRARSGGDVLARGSTSAARARSIM